MFLIESFLTVAALGLAFIRPELGARSFEFCERAFRKLAGRKRLSVLVVGLSALALRVALLPILHIPVPAVHDEYGYLLLADTFAHGRVTNPSNPMWVHFESFHIIWQPTYTAMFYPAQGLFLALGQVLLGHPFWGVWLSVGLMCAATCWMLQGWLEPGWALFGGFLAVIRLGTFSYWANSYWGGAVAALGGALVLGALPRIMRSPRVRDALLMGLGLAMIANSRPYEGLFFGLPVAVALLIWMLRHQRPPMALVARRCLAPLTLVLMLAGSAMAYYFWRTTGNPLRPPYTVNVATYNPVPYFAWQSVKPAPVYHHFLMQALYLGPALERYRAARTVPGLIAIESQGLSQLWGFFLGTSLTLPLLMALALTPYGFSWKQLSYGTRLMLIVCASVILATMIPIWSNPHYAAPITGALLALVVTALRSLRAWQWRGRPAGLFLTRAVPLICVVMLVLRIAANPLHIPLPAEWPGQGSSTPLWCTPAPGNLDRAETLKKLETFPGRQLAIVHYHPIHEIALHEWVYNRADIDSAKVIWARDMGPAKNQELVSYFKDRHAWIVEADDNPPKITVYNPPSGP